MSYRKGYRVELRCRSELREMGAALIVRSAASKTPADLVAFFPDRGEVWLVQCKKAGSAPVKQETRERRFADLKKLEGTYRVKAVLYTWDRDKKRYGFIEL